MAKSKKNFSKKNNNSRNNRNYDYSSGRTKQREFTESDSTSRSKSQDVSRGIGFNDPTWYSFDSRLDDSVYNFPTTSFIGVDAEMGQYTDADSDFKYYYNSPSIMVIRTNPSVGYVGSENDSFFNIQNAPINMAMLRLYNELSSINAKTTNYQPQDLAMAILAVGEVLSIAQYIKRTLTIPYISNPRNRTFPRTATAACGVDYDDLKSNLAVYRVRFNTIMAAANAILMFDNFNWFKKCANMYRHIIADSDSALAQTYIISPYSTWILDEQINVQGSVLRTVTVPFGAATTLADHLDLLDEMVRALLNSSTLNYVYADIKNYVTKRGGSLVSFDLMSEDERTEITLPSVSKDFHLQLMNATIMGRPMDASQMSDFLGEDSDLHTPDNDVLPSVNYNSIQYAPSWVHNVTLDGFRPLLNYMYEPDQAARMESVRLQSVPTSYTTIANATGYVNSAYLTDHYIVSISVLDRTMDVVNNETVIGVEPLITFSNDNPTYWLNNTIRQSLMSQFDYAPLMYTAKWPEDPSNVMRSDMYITGDVNWYTQIDDKTRDAILYTSFLGLFKF